MSEVFSPESLTIKDLFAAKELEREEYDPALAAIYCEYILEGRSLLGAAEAIYASLDDEDADNYEGMTYDEKAEAKKRLRKSSGVYYRKFLRWRAKFPKFDKMVNLALQERSYALVEEIIDIADDATDDAVMGAQGPIINGKAIRRAELMINSRKFLAGKMLPKVFGDKSQMEITGADGKDLIPTTFNISLIPTGKFMGSASEEQPNGETAASAGDREET